MLTSLVFLKEGNVKKSEKSIKIVNTEGEGKSSYLLNDLRYFTEISGKMWLMTISKVTKN